MDPAGRPAHPPGRVIGLNGTTSAGKSTLAAALQAQLGAAGECWIILGIDDFLGKLPLPWLGYVEVGAHADEGLTFVRPGATVGFRAGPVGSALLRGYRRSVAAVVHAGVNVVIDEVMIDDDAWEQWVRVLDGRSPFWVRVDCPLEVREGRELARGDRLIGLARSQEPVVHRSARYDLVVDTSVGDAESLARTIIDASIAARDLHPDPGSGDR